MTVTVFISGATGFIAQHIIVKLLEKGYAVVGSVRSEAKGENLKRNFNSKDFCYEVVDDLESKGAFETALRKHPEVKVFLHTASPVTYTPKDNEKDVILPAVNGTKNVLHAIKESSPQITRVVLTSSIVSQLSFANRSKIVDENSWNDITYETAKSDGVAAYFGSKTFAEKAAWEFLETEKPNFSLVTFHPVFVFGPQAFDSDAKGALNLSNGCITSVLELKPGQEIVANKDVFVDVRDVADAHIIGFEKADAAGKRLIIYSGCFTSQSILDIVNQNVPELKGKILTGSPGSQPVGESSINDAKSREFLGIQYISLEKSVTDTVRQYVENSTTPFNSPHLR